MGGYLKAYLGCFSYSDFCRTYALVFPKDRRRCVEKRTSQLAHIERWHSTVRQRLARYVRKSLSLKSCFISIRWLSDGLLSLTSETMLISHNLNTTQPKNESKAKHPVIALSTSPLTASLMPPAPCIRVCFWLKAKAKTVFWRRGKLPTWT